MWFFLRVEPPWGFDERTYSVTASSNGLLIADPGMTDTPAPPEADRGRRRGRRRTTRFVRWSDIAGIEFAHHEAATVFVRILLHDGSAVTLSAGHLSAGDHSARAAQARDRYRLLNLAWAEASP